MPLPSELKDREDRLKADEVNWRAKRTQLERTIQKHLLVLDELTPKVEHLSGLIKDKSTEYEQLSIDYRQLSAEFEIKKQQIDHIDRKITKSQTILADLEAFIESKRQKIDTEIIDWSNKRRQEIRAQQRSDEDIAGDTREALSALQIQLVAKREEIDAMREEIVSIRLGQKGELAEHQDAIASLTQKQLPLEASIEALTEEIVKLQRTREVVVAETVKAKLQFDGFIDYEKRARKVLDTKDRELQDKAQEIAQLNRHLTARTSFLADL